MKLVLKPAILCGILFQAHSLFAAAVDTIGEAKSLDQCQVQIEHACDNHATFEVIVRNAAELIKNQDSIEKAIEFVENCLAQNFSKASSKAEDLVSQLNDSFEERLKALRAYDVALQNSLKERWYAAIDSLFACELSSSSEESFNYSTESSSSTTSSSSSSSTSDLSDVENFETDDEDAEEFESASDFSEESSLASGSQSDSNESESESSESSR